MRVVAGIAAVTLLSGGAGAFAATQLASNHRQAYINDVAGRLKVTPAALTTAMKQARIDQVNAAEKAGKLTAAQASAAKTQIESGHTGGGFGGRGGAGGWPSQHGWFACGHTSTSTATTKASRCSARPPKGHGGHFGRYFTCGGSSTSATTKTTATPCAGMHGFGRHAARGHGSFGGGLFGLGASAVTGYLGVSSAALRSDLAAGKSLAQIATTTPGKSVSGLTSALTAAYKTALAKAVSTHRITSAQEAKALALLSSQLPKLLKRSFEFPRAGGFHSSRHP